MVKLNVKILGSITVFLGMIIFCQTIVAQTQIGVVKTRGKIVNGQLVPGHGLKGTTVVVRHRTPILVNSENGSFSFPIPSKQFYVESVTKKGYLLVDAEACKTYQYSMNPICFVMDTPEQQLEDQIAAEKRIRHALQKQLQEKENEIEALKEQNKITQEEYHKSLLQLYTEQDNNEQLIKDMAAQYSKIDYDQIDEFYRQVSCYILDGELTKADSLLRSRGDVSSQAKEKMHQKQLLYDRKEELKKAESVLDAEIEELARRCYSYYETFLMKHQNDSAAYYIELRASLDTTNFEWQYETGQFLSTYLAEYQKALNYYFRIVRMEESIPEEHVAQAFQGIGYAYYYHGDFDHAMVYFNQGLEKFIHALGENNKKTSAAYLAIGNVYSDYDFEKAEKYFEKAKYTNMDSDQLASYYASKGFLFVQQKEYDTANDCFEKALDIRLKIYGETHPAIASCYNNLGYLYYYQGQYKKAEYYFTKARVIDSTFYGTNHPQYASRLSNLASIYYIDENYDKALDYFNRVLKIRIQLLGNRHPDIALTYNNIGFIYTDIGKSNEAVPYHQKALDIFTSVYGKHHSDVAITYQNLGYAYIQQDLFLKAIQNYQEALDIYQHLNGENDDDVAIVYGKLGNAYSNNNDFTNAIQMHTKALKIRLALHGESNSLVALSYYNLGSTYLQQGNYAKSVENLEKSLQIWISLIDENDSKIQKARARLVEAKEKLEAQKKEKQE